MWRSFFYAIGIGLFTLGAEGLVLDSVVVQKNGKIQKLISKILSDDSANTSQPGTAVTTTPPSEFASRPASNGWNGQPFSGNAGSRFGPSRFSGPAYGNYGGARLNSPGNSIPQSNNTANAQLTAYRGSVASEPNFDTKRFSNFSIREWMPWSLLALGAIIFLYTHSTSRNQGE